MLLCITSKRTNMYSNEWIDGMILDQFVKNVLSRELSKIKIKSVSDNA